MVWQWIYANTHEAIETAIGMADFKELAWGQRARYSHYAKPEKMFIAMNRGGGFHHCHLKTVWFPYELDYQDKPPTIYTFQVRGVKTLALENT